MIRSSRHFLFCLLTVSACATMQFDQQTSVESNVVDQLRPLLKVPVQVTVGNDANFAPDISINGRYLVHTTSINGNKEINLKDRKKKQQRLLTRHPADDFAPAISPDGDRVAFLTRRMDAAGDIALVDVKAPLFSLSTQAEARIAHRPQTEELAATWFPDSKALIVPVRDTAGIPPKLMRIDAEKLEWQDLNIRGEFPHISADGKLLVFVREAKIVIYNFSTKTQKELVGIGAGVWARPRFAYDGKSLVTVRYCNDTNLDGTVDGADHGTIWQIPLNAISLTTSQPIQLTSASLNAYLPELRAEGLYVTLEAKGTLEIFKLPPTGQTRSEWQTTPEDQWLWNLKNVPDQLFALETLATNQHNKGNENKELEYRLRSLEERLNTASAVEMRIAAEDIRLRHPDNPSSTVMLRAAEIIVGIRPELNALSAKTASTAAQNRVHTAVEQLNKLSQEAKTKHQNQTELIAYLATLQTELLLKLGNTKDAKTKLDDVSNQASYRTRARAALLSAELAGATSGAEYRETQLLEVVREPSFPSDLRRRAANLFVSSLVERKIDSESFERARRETKGLKFVPSLLHEQMATQFVASGNSRVGVAEYRQILADHCKEDPLFMPEIASTYVRLALIHGGIDDVDQTLKEATECIAKQPVALAEMRQIRANALVSLGQKLMREKEYGQALKSFRSATEVDPQSMAAWRGLIDASWRRKVLSDLTATLDKMVAQDNNDVVALYGRGYAETYGVDDAKSPATKLSAIDRSIELVSKARDLEPLQIFPQQTLGWLYIQRGHWLERMRGDGGLVGRSSAFLARVRNVLGRPEENSTELAVDSFHAALFLAEDQSQERANLIQNLGEAYYQLENHQKALTYFGERIKLSKEHPFGDVNAEASVLRLAGRSAFQIDELELAEELQKRALKVWQTTGDDSQISYSMDALALTLRERKKYPQAIQLYRDLHERHRVAKRGTQAQLSLSNLGYALYMNGQGEEALQTFAASDQLTTEEQGQASAKSDAIAVDIGGQASAAKGFDDTGRKNLNLTFSARILEELGRYTESVAKYNAKISLLREAAKDAKDAKRRSLIEEAIITRNNLAWVLVEAGRLTEASDAFKTAVEESEQLRLPGYGFSKDESLNGAAWARTQLRMVALGIVGAESLPAVLQRLKAIEDAAKSSEANASQAPLAKEVLAKVRIVRSAVEAAITIEIGKRNELLTTALTAAAESIPENLPLDLRSMEVGLIAIEAQLSPPKGALAKILSQMREAMASSDPPHPERWRYAAVEGEPQALELLDQALASKPALQNIHDKNRILHLTAHAFDSASQEDRALVLRKALRIFALNQLRQLLRSTPRKELNEQQLKAQENLLTHLSLKTNQDLENVLTESDTLLNALDDGESIRYATFSGGQKNRSLWNTGVARGPNDLVSPTGSKRVFFSCVGGRCMEIQKHLRKEGVRVAILATTEMVPRLASTRRLPTTTITVLTSTEPNQEESLWKQGLTGHDVQVIRKERVADLSATVGEAHLSVFTRPLLVGADKPWNTEFLGKNELVAGLPLRQTISQKPWFGTALVIPRMRIGRDVTDAIEAMNTLSLWLLERNIPMALVKTEPEASARDESAATLIVELQGLLKTQSLAPTADYFIIGDAGVLPEEASRFAANRLDLVREQALDARDDGDLASARRLLMEAAHYAALLKRDDDALEINSILVKMLFQSQEFSAALHFQEVKIAALRQKKAPNNQIIPAEMEAGILGVRAGQTDKAREHLAIAETWYKSEDEDIDLAKVHHYRGLAYEIDTNYPATIAEYTTSRNLYRKAGEAGAAAQKLLDIGNIYKERLGNFPLALEHYDKAHSEFTAANMKDRLPRVQIDRANTLMAMGETRWAINIMESRVLNQLDVDDEPLQWCRAAQITANAYYHAGLYHESQQLLDKILKNTPEIQDQTQKTITEIDAKNLIAMILEKLGQHAEATRIFREVLTTTRKFRMRGKEALILNNVGFWEREAGQIVDSIAHFKEALTIDEELRSEQDQAYDLRNLGLSLTLSGDLVQAEAAVTRALKTSSKLKLAYNEAYSLFALAEIADRKNDRTAAISYFEKARTVAEKAFLQDFVWRAYAATGFVRAKNNDPAGATKDLASAIVVIEKLRAGLPSESSRTGFASDRGVQDVYAEIVLALMKQQRVSEAWQYSERGRARAFIDAMGSRALAFGEKELDDALELERRLRSDAELEERRTALLPVGSPEEAAGQEKLAARRKAHGETLNTIQSRWPKVMSFLGVRPIDVTYVGEKIGADTALLEFMVLRDYTAYWVIANGKIQGGLIEVGRERLRTLIDQYRELMQNFAAVAAPSKELSRLLLQGPVSLMGGIKNLIIVPHSELHYLPFAALPLDKNYLIDRFPVSYLESAEMLRFVSDKKQKITSTSHVLALGNPDRGPDLDLPFAEREVKAIKRYFSDAKIAIGKDATIGFFKTNLNRIDIFHFAGHGEFSNADPSSSRLLFAGEEGKDDLTVKDILAMRIPVALVTLSACETGLGKLTAGDEMVSFNRAFFFAGTESLLTSLWRISDVASSVTVKRLYAALSENKSRAEALRDAQMIVRKYYGHPAYWSSFKLSGSPE